MRSPQLGLGHEFSGRRIRADNFVPLVLARALGWDRPQGVQFGLQLSLRRQVLEEPAAEVGLFEPVLTQEVLPSGVVIGVGVVIRAQ